MFKTEVEKELQAQVKAIQGATRGPERADLVYDHVQAYINNMLGDKPLNLQEYANVTAMFLANVVAALPNRSAVNDAFKDITMLAREIGKQGRREKVVDIRSGQPMIDSQGNNAEGA